MTADARTPLPPVASTAAGKAAVLVEALPWLSRFAGSTVVVKYGGAAMTDPSLRSSFATDLLFLRQVGLRPVVVHGGGPQISAHLARIGMTTEFVRGLRVTSAEAMAEIRMVLVGQVNRDLVSLVNRSGPYAVGLSGEDGRLFVAGPRNLVVDGAPVDLGRVGEITSIGTGLVAALLADGRIPVVAPVAMGEDGGSYNVNADTAASALAVALAAEKLLVLTDVPGLYRNWPDTGEVVPVLTVGQGRALLPGLSSGMVPKLTACLDAVAGGVGQAHILDGRQPHSLLVEILTDEGTGTMVTPQ